MPSASKRNVRTLRGNPDPILGTAFQTMEGFGATFRAFDHPDFWGVNAAGTGGTGMPLPVLTNAQQDVIFDLMYTPAGIGLTRARTCDPTTSRIASGVMDFSIENPNDNADPYSANMAGFNFSPLDGLSDYVVRARQRDLKTWWWSPSFREAWMGAANDWGSGISGATTPNATMVAEYAEWYVEIVKAFSDRNAMPDFLSTGNEPSYPGGANRMAKEWVRDILKEVGPRLQARGLLRPFTLGDDNTLAFANNMVDLVMADTAAKSYVSSFSTHLYDGPLANATGLKARGVTHGVPVWMSEFSYSPINTITDAGAHGFTNDQVGYAALMHECISTYGMTAVDYMMGFFGSQEGSCLVQANYTTGAYLGYTIRKEGYFFSQFSKHVRPGMVRVSVSSSNSTAKVSMYHTEGKRVIVAVNSSASPVTTTITAADLGPIASLSPTRTSASENWAALASQPVSGASFTATLPAGSATTFVGLR